MLKLDRDRLLVGKGLLARVGPLGSLQPNYRVVLSRAHALLSLRALEPQRGLVLREEALLALRTLQSCWGAAGHRERALLALRTLQLCSGLFFCEEALLASLGHLGCC